MMEPDYAPRNKEGKPLKSNVRAFTSSFNPYEAEKKALLKRKYSHFQYLRECLTYLL